MDELNMDSLELPEMEHDYNELPDAYDDAENIEPEKSREDDLSDIEMPVLSEMDGSAVAKPAAVQSASRPAVSVSVADMGVSAPSVPKSSSSPASAGYTPVSSASGIVSSSSNAASYSGIYGGNGTGTVQSNMTSSADNYFAENSMAWSEDYEKGKKIAKTVGIVAIVLDVLETLTMLSIRNILVTVLRIVLTLGFIKGSNNARKYTGYFSILRIIMNIACIMQVDSMTREFAEAGFTAFITITELIYFIGIFANCAVIYFTMFDKRVKEYTVEK